jgi:hypothetical protein
VPNASQPVGNERSQSSSRNLTSALLAAALLVAEGLIGIALVSGQPPLVVALLGCSVPCVTRCICLNLTA